jgi:hypothetical protein
VAESHPFEKCFFKIDTHSFEKFLEDMERMISSKKEKAQQYNLLTECTTS